MYKSAVLVVLLAACLLSIADGLVIPLRPTSMTSCARPSTLLTMAVGDKKRKRRRRKPGATAADPVKQDREATEGIDEDDEEDEVITKDDLMALEDVAKFVYKPKTDVAASGEYECKCK
jgi:hypothetical protein